MRPPIIQLRDSLDPQILGGGDGLKIAFGISWDDTKKGSVAAALLCALLALTLVTPAQMQASATAANDLVSVIVRELPGAGDQAEEAVAELNGSVGMHIDLIDGFVAELPRAALPLLEQAPTVRSVSLDRPIKMLQTAWDPATDSGSWSNVAASVKARDFYQDGFRGQGVDIAMIDTGALPVDGLQGPKVYLGPDLTQEGLNPYLHGLDTYGHGTHIAGIIAGKANSTGTLTKESSAGFHGIAPDSRLVSVKVAGSSGATDVSQVIAAIDWVVKNRNANGLNIKVLNLSFGTDSTQDYRVDPLSFAAEAAWHSGITVVVAAGNQGFGDTRLNNPAINPYVIAVGASDTKGTYDTADDVVPDWSARGDGTRNPDLVAPGKSSVSLRAPGATVDNENPSARVADKFFRGSGTSQAAAVVSGAAALVINQRPGITPDQVKALLKGTARPLPVADPVSQGAGTLDLKNAARTATPTAVQTWARSNGLGSLDASRGSLHLERDGVVLSGEQDIFGQPWDGAAWANGSGWSGSGWSGSGWSGSGWSGSGWSGSGWSDMYWAGSGWSGSGWSGSGWSGSGWSGSGWSGSGWSGSGWSGSGWSGSGWSGSGWSGSGWSGSGWSGSGWSGSGWSGSGWSGSGWSGSGWSGSGWSGSGWS